MIWSKGGENWLPATYFCSSTPQILRHTHIKVFVLSWQSCEILKFLTYRGRSWEPMILTDLSKSYNLKTVNSPVSKSYDLCTAHTALQGKSKQTNIPPPVLFLCALSRYSSLKFGHHPHICGYVKCLCNLCLALPGLLDFLLPFSSGVSFLIFFGLSQIWNSYNYCLSLPL